ncbi:cell wall-binding repeat-containing protein [Herbiconiux sp. 11R-BC]|uniref:cell wall-binding repeat-containing protein n=1 Tax=Herbiconiux sp. 11R-BC TaxID=3111637 RepID=UPI003C0E1A30
MKSFGALATATAVLLALVLAPGGAAGAASVKRCPLMQRVSPGVERLGGADRYEVAVHASQAAFPAGADVVYFASGATFPDALSGSAVAGAQRGPVLLLPKDEVPPAVKAELARLAPARIVFLGGTQSISAELEQSLRYFPASFERVAGADRYEVSVSLARKAFNGASRRVFVASGEGFPDALSASAAAGDAGGPVLLVTKNAVPEVVLDLLREEVQLQDIVVVGGPATISDAVVAQLAPFARVNRIGGVDRFAASAATSAYEFCADRSTVFVASGAVFPDALAGSAAAIAAGGPVLLVGQDSVPADVAAELRRLNPMQIKVLGGPNTVSERVVADLAQYLRP